MKIFRREDFAYHKVSVVFWQTDEHDQPAIVTEPYEKAFTAANLKKEQEFYDSDLTFRIRAVKAGEGEKTKTLTLKPTDNAAKKFKALMADRPEILSVEWTHRHYVQDDEYIPHGEDIEAFLKREIAKPIIRWEETRRTGRRSSATRSCPTSTSTATSRPRPRPTCSPSSGGWSGRRRRCWKGWRSDESTRSACLEYLTGGWTLTAIKDVGFAVCAMRRSRLQPQMMDYLETRRP